MSSHHHSGALLHEQGLRSFVDPCSCMKSERSKLVGTHLAEVVYPQECYCYFLDNSGEPVYLLLEQEAIGRRYHLT